MISVEFISSNDRNVHLHKFLINVFVTLGVIAAYLFFKKSPWRWLLLLLLLLLLFVVVAVVVVVVVAAAAVAVVVVAAAVVVKNQSLSLSPPKCKTACINIEST